MQRGSFKLMKKMNQQIILDLIHEKQAISRAKVAEITNLSPATVSNIVKELLEMELVRETKRGESRGGRKPILLEINPEGAYVIGLEWGISEIRAVLLDLNSNLLNSRELLVDDFKPDNYIQKTLDTIEYLTKNNKDKKIYGIGIGIHGLVDPEYGISRFAPHFRWENVPIKEMLIEEVEFPVLIDNDVRMMALTEQWAGNDNFIFINTGPGIGAAIIFKGELFYGHDCSAGEFGHMTIVEDGPLCSCGNHGCLEALISLNKLVQEFNPELASGLSYLRLKEEWLNLIIAARAETEDAISILKKASIYLGTGIANLTNLLNPEIVIIGGPFTLAEDILFPLIRKQVYNKALKIPGKNLKISSSRFKEKAGAIGAGIRVLQELFKVNYH